MANDIMMCKLVVYGLVQGVGFRPYVAELGRQLNIRGTVKNVGGIVHILACGNRKVIEDFSYRLSSFDGKNPLLPGAKVNHIEIRELSREEYESMTGDPEDLVITESGQEPDRIRILPADVATCKRCEEELTNPDNRRYHHPFISCVSCGPRFSVMERVPYDRESLSMKIFPFCPECEREYTQLHNIRRHAQTIACKDCGPKLFLAEKNGEEVKITFSKKADDTLLEKAATALKQGRILGIKNVGGYHFSFDPYNEEAAKRLRLFKNRERKPFAIMFPDIDYIEQYCILSPLEKELLQSPKRPIVLVKKRTVPKGESFAPGVCASSPYIGAMLPCDPVQILLIKITGPLVMTSGNLGGEPIITDDDHMLSYLGENGIDMVLGNDRPIVNALDDSVLQVIKPSGTEQVQIIRRARGYVPEPIFLKKALKADSFAAGGDLKAVFALGREHAVYLSGHFGDLMDYRAATKRREGIDHLKEILGIEPAELICDLHPGYVSVREAKDPLSSSKTGVGMPGDPSGLHQIQHHYAHVLSVMAEHDLERVLGFAFDGTGLGTDQAIWGGEMLICTKEGFDRVGQLSYIPLTGGDAVAKNARQAAYCYGLAAMQQGYLDEGDVPFGKEPFAALVKAAWSARMQTVETSSTGRLFDAVCAILGLGEDNSFEGECPQLLQSAAEQELERLLNKNELSCAEALMAGDWQNDPSYISDLLQNGEEQKTLRLELIEKDERIQADVPRFIADLVHRLKKGDKPGTLALEFHVALAKMAGEMADMVLSKRDDLQAICLSGGSMNNRLLLSLLVAELGGKGLPVYTNEQVPCSDGGIALGQMYYLAD